MISQNTKFSGCTFSLLDDFLIAYVTWECVFCVQKTKKEEKRGEMHYTAEAPSSVRYAKYMRRIQCVRWRAVTQWWRRSFSIHLLHKSEWIWLLPAIKYWTRVERQHISVTINALEEEAIICNDVRKEMTAQYTSGFKSNELELSFVL